MPFITDSEIVKKLTAKYDTVSLDTIPIILSEIPNVIKLMEENYKTLRGQEKKRLVITTVINLMKISGMKEEDITLIYEVLPDLVDSIVTLTNVSGTLFKKVKRTKLCCCK